MIEGYYAWRGGNRGEGGEEERDIWSQPWRRHEEISKRKYRRRTRRRESEREEEPKKQYRRGLRNAHDYRMRQVKRSHKRHIQHYTLGYTTMQRHLHIHTLSYRADSVLGTLQIRPKSVFLPGRWAFHPHPFDIDRTMYILPDRVEV